MTLEEHIAKMLRGIRKPSALLVNTKIGRNGQRSGHHLVEGVNKYLLRNGYDVKMVSTVEQGIKYFSNVKDPDIVLEVWNKSFGTHLYDELKKISITPAIYAGIIAPEDRGADTDPFTQNCDIVFSNADLSIGNIARVLTEKYLSQAKPLVYFVDDNEEIRRLAGVFLATAGFDVETEASTNRAGEALTRGEIRPAVLFIDYHNPGNITGNDVVTGIPPEIRRNMVVIGISGDHFEKQQRDIYCAIYRKPFDWNDSAKCALQLLAAQRGTSSSTEQPYTVIGCNK